LFPERNNVTPKEPTPKNKKPELPEPANKAHPKKKPRRNWSHMFSRPELRGRNFVTPQHQKISTQTLTPIIQHSVLLSISLLFSFLFYIILYFSFIILILFFLLSTTTMILFLFSVFDLKNDAAKILSESYR
jgi:hypothetical protein